MSEELLEKLRSYLSYEQEFQHRVFIDKVVELDGDEAREVLSLIHTNYLIRGKLLENICKYCINNDIELPSFGDLIRMQ